MRAFLDRAFQLRVARLKPIRRRHALARAAQETGAMHPRTKIRTISAILPRPAASERSETEPPKSRVLCTPPFLDRAFQLRVASLKPIRRRHALARAARETGAMHPRNTAAPFLDRWLNCASLVCHWRGIIFGEDGWDIWDNRDLWDADAA